MQFASPHITNIEDASGNDLILHAMLREGGS